jgi:putative ATP-dependent endonuclease of OLD family
MRLHALSIRNFRGIRECTFCPDSRSNLSCLIGPGDAGKSTILTAIAWVFWPRYSLGIGDIDFYECDTSNVISIEATFSGFPDELIRESKFALYQRCQPTSNGRFDTDDDPSDGEQPTLTIRLMIDETLEPQWFVVKNSQEPKRISAADRAKIPVCVIDTQRNGDMLWGRYSLLQRYAASNDAVKATSMNAARRLSKMELDDLDMATKPVAEAIRPFGVHVSHEELVNHFVMAGANMPSQVGLFDGSIPLLYLGQGSRRLFSTGLAFAMATTGSLILIDEIESGLEPHRLSNLISLLKGNSASTGRVSSQSIFTTHSPIALQELKHDELYAVTRQDNGTVMVHHMVSSNPDVNEELQGQLRAAPSSFLAPRVYVCEGHTELGLMKAIDEHHRQSHGVGLTAAGVALSDAGGSDNMFSYAKHLKEAGYSPCIFMDSDVAQHQQRKEEARNAGIDVFDWDDGNMTELQVFLDVDDEAVKESIGLAAELRGEQSIRGQLLSKGLDFDALLSMNVVPEATRRTLGLLAHKKSWFKNIERGRRLGVIIIEHADEACSSSRTLYETLNKLERWALG